MQAAEINAIKEGKKPYYLRKSERKKQQLIAKYHRLKEEGRLERYLRKRRSGIQTRGVGTFGQQ